ncbi:MAG: family 10 glycosylhydrolase [Ignavibacteriales bacterium]|nr:family 10 glycosylhydrolase [Ignavibacteriales bacterium]
MKLKIFVVFLLTLTIYQAQTQEFRGVWLTNVDSYVLDSDANIIEAMNYLSSIGINVVFPVVYNKGYTLYPSQIMDSLFGEPVLPSAIYLKNRDYLERMIIEAHRLGMEVIPWFEFGFSTSYSLNGGHIIAKFPHWALKNKSGNLVVKNGFDWSSGINPEVQNYMNSLIFEVINNYDVDGIQGDDRLPAMPVEGGYDSVTVEIYKSEHGGSAPPTNEYNTAWMRWRADKLNQYLNNLKNSIKAVDENLILSVSPSPWDWGYSQYLQDSKVWAQDSLVDNLIPQLYREDISSYNAVLNVNWTNVGALYPEIFFAGMFIHKKNPYYLISPTLLSQMIQANRSKNVKGECYFFYEGLRDSNNKIGDYLKNNFYTEKTLLPYRKGIKWRPPASIVNEDSSAVTQIGTWVLKSRNGWEGKMLKTTDSNYAALEYHFDVDFDCYYDLFEYRVPNTTYTKNAVFTLYSDSSIYNCADTILAIIDQTNTNKTGWHKIGTVYLKAESNKKVIKVDNSLLESDRELVADAIMLMVNRKKNPDLNPTSINDFDKKVIQPENLILYQNYPNPFNPVTKIKFALPSDNRVTLKIFDVLGQEVTTLVDEHKKSGTYEIQFDATNLSSGIYFYQLKSGNNLQVKKCILIK